MVLKPAARKRSTARAPAPVIHLKNSLDAAVWERDTKALLQAEQDAELRAQDAARREIEKLVMKGLAAYKKSGLPLFYPPPKRFGSFGLAEFEGRWWMCLVTDDGLEPLFTMLEIEKLGVVYKDREGQPYAVRIAFLAPDGNRQVVELDGDDIVSPKAINAIKKLRSGGCGFAIKGIPLFADYLMQTQPEGMPVYDRAGYHEEGFLLPTGGSVLNQRPMGLADTSTLHCQAQSGTYEGWVAASHAIFSGKNRTAQFGWLSGLVGNLVDLQQGDSAVFLLEGKSSTGKSSAQAIGAAHWASPKLGDGLFISSSATTNALEVPIEKGAGTVVGLDENRYLSAHDCQQLIFSVQQGTGKLRAKRNGALQRSRKFRTCLVISAEVGMTQRLEQEGKAAAGGLTVRAMTIFTDGVPPPTEVDLAAVRAIIGDGAGSQANYGWGGPAFVRALADQGFVANPSRLKAEIDAVVRSLVPPDTGKDLSMATRSARNAALLHVAATISQKAGLLPADFDVSALVHELWSEFRDSDGAPSNPIDKAIQTLCSSLIARTGLDVFDIGDTPTRDPVAWTAELPDSHPAAGRRVFVIRPQRLASLSGGAVADRDLRKALKRAGYVVSNPREDRNVIQWSSFPGLGKAEYLVLWEAAVLSEETDPPSV